MAEDAGVDQIVGARQRHRQRIVAVIRRGLQRVRDEVAEENGLLGAQLVIALGQSHVLVLVRDRAVDRLAAGVWRRGVEGHHLQRRRAEQRHGDLIAGERVLPVGSRGVFQRDRLARHCTAGDVDGAEIALQHGGRRNEAERLAGIGSNDVALIAEEEKQLVLLDRSADGAAELVALERIAHGRGGIAGVEFIVADKLERVAVKVCCRRSWSRR